MKKSITTFFICSLVAFGCLSLTSCNGKVDSSIDEKCINGAEHLFTFHQGVKYEEENGTDNYYSCENCQKIFDENKKVIDSIPIAKPLRKIIIPVKKNGEIVDTLSSIVRGYFNCKSDDEIAAYLFSKQNFTSNDTNGVLFSYIEKDCVSPVSLQLSLDDTFQNIVREEKPNNTIFSLYNLEPNTYYYRYIDGDGNVSLVDHFSMVPIRTIKTNENQVVNMRDLGGWETITGDKIKYGKLYRSALPSENDLSLFHNLGIKTELDLRILNGSGGKDEIGSFRGINSSINYVMGLEEGVQYWPQYDEMFKTGYKAVNKAYFKKIFDVFSDETYYPIDFHCASGADRTGTLAYIINGLCGVSYDNLCKDYELTSFYRSPRWRSNIVGDKFDDTGVMANGSFGLMHKHIIDTYGGEGISLSKAILNFLTSYCCVDSNKIKMTLSILLEGHEYLNLFK